MPIRRRTNSGAGTPILLYHRIAAGVATRDPYVLPASRFRQQMAYLVRRGYRAVSPDEALAKDLSPTAERTVCLTFDDGYEDFLEVAHPILSAHGFTATVFVVCEQVGQSATWDGADGSRLLSWDQVRWLQEAGIRFGSHTMSHRRLTELDALEIRRELVTSREVLTTELSERISWLAYPYGASNERVRSLASEAGYVAAFGVRDRVSGPLGIRRRECLSIGSGKSFRFSLGQFEAAHAKINKYRIMLQQAADRRRQQR